MQFQFNSDYPAIDATGNPRPAAVLDARPSVEFPPVQPLPCARITTRVYHPTRRQALTVQNVIVRIKRRRCPPVAASSGSASSQQQQQQQQRRKKSSLMTGNSKQQQQQQQPPSLPGVGADSNEFVMEDDDAGMMSGSENNGNDNSSNSSSSSDDLASTSDESMGGMDDNNNGNNLMGATNGSNPLLYQQGLNPSAPGAVVVDMASSGPGAVLVPEDDEDRAYWVQRTIREAIYGRVLLAVILKKRDPSSAAADNAEWLVTSQLCAVKEMSWQHIRKERDRLAEDPVKEVAAMQYIKAWHYSCNRQTTNSSANSDPVVAASPSAAQDCVSDSFAAMLETNIMMPLDLLSDDRHLYSVMPYCDGGELFERLDANERFSEAEARYWMHQVLNGLENLQNAGICHRDMSLENLLVHNESGALIIDMGMCLRIPFVDDATPAASQGQPYPQLTASMQNMSVANGGHPTQAPYAIPSTSAPAISASAPNCNSLPLVRNGRVRPRSLILPQGTCGKWIYMSPEICRDKEPFDGFAVDVWASGVILFLMLTGFPPWDRASPTDERFKYMTAGYLVQMLTEWNLGLSPDALDLLQRMLFLDPKDRLSLDQVRAHPWMVNGPLAPPTNLPGF